MPLLRILMVGAAASEFRDTLLMVIVGEDCATSRLETESVPPPHAAKMKQEVSAALSIVERDRSGMPIMADFLGDVM